MNIIIFHFHESHLNWFSGLMPYLRKLGHNVRRFCNKNIPDEKIRKIVKSSDHVFIWNGETIWACAVKKACSLYKKPFTIMEVGWFPQSKFWFLDSKGINANSSLMVDDLNWVTSELIDKSRIFFNNYLSNYTYKNTNKYILCPLQLPRDTNITKFSPYKNMQLFINHVEREFSDRTILFKKHPKDKKQYSSKFSILDVGNFLELAQDAELVYGINSTTLLESAALGIPTIGIGSGLFKKHYHQIEKLLAALVCLQIPARSTDLDFWFQRDSHIRYLVSDK